LKEDVIENKFQLYKSIQIKKSIERTWIKYEGKKIKGYYEILGGQIRKSRRIKKKKEEVNRGLT
jgi:hypothetical protein